MPTPVLTLDPATPDPALLKRAARVLAAGGLVVFPTETLYGIAVDCHHAAALARLAALKGRPAGKPFPLILARAGEVEDIAASVPPGARQLMARYWPGPLTLVLAARPGLHPSLGWAGGVAVRLSPHPVAAGLARALGRAITATSANLSGGPAPTSPQELDPVIAAGVELILDAGPTPGGPPSTLADARQDPPMVLRAGAVPL